MFEGKTDSQVKLDGLLIALSSHIRGMNFCMDFFKCIVGDSYFILLLAGICMVMVCVGG